MKIYTKTGDTGSTSLFGGDRVMKHNERVDAYGTVDELNSFVGAIPDYIQDSAVIATIRTIQDKLFVIGSHLATVDPQYIKKLPAILDADVEYLEQLIDQYNETLPPMTHFILPGGHPAVSFCHISRTVCRRAERSVVSIAEHHQINPILIVYLNRLSDFLFVLARKLTYDLKINEIIWNPKGA